MVAAAHRCYVLFGSMTHLVESMATAATSTTPTYKSSGPGAEEETAEEKAKMQHLETFACDADAKSIKTYDKRT